MDSPQECDTAFQLLELPAAVLRNVILCLWADGRDVAKLSVVCTFLSNFIADPLLWRQLLLQRFGESVLPGLQPTLEQSRHVELDGWVFYQGVDGSDPSDKQHPEADLAQLAQLAKGAEAFTTCGRVIPCLQPQGQWARTSFRPADGMYVREAVVAAREVDPPEAGADHPWPPHVPGWVYFPSCISPDYFKEEPATTLTRHKSIRSLLDESMGRVGVVAVATSGETKVRLRPQACWKVSPAYDVGLYVQQSVVNQAGLVPHPPVPDYRQLYSKLHKPRLDAAQMSACWLNDHYLSLTASPDSPADSGMTLVLNQVWWLDVSGSIAGVPPGSYDVLWVVDVTATEMWESSVINLSAEAKPNQHTASSSSSGSAATPACPAAAAAAANSGAGGASSSAAGSSSSEQTPAAAGPVTVQVRSEEIRQLGEQCRGQGVRWGALSGGVLQVRDYSTVHLRFWATEDGAFKQNMRWAYVELRPLDQAGAGAVRPGQAAADAAAAAANAAVAAARAGAGAVGGAVQRGFAWLADRWGNN